MLCCSGYCIVIKLSISKVPDYAVLSRNVDVVRVAAIMRQLRGRRPVLPLLSLARRAYETADEIAACIRPETRRAQPRDG